MPDTTPTNMPETMPDENEEWTDVNRGLGTQVELEAGESFVGYLTGTSETEAPDPFNPGKTRTSTAFQFAPVDDPDDLIFLWGNAILDKALNQVQLGEKVRITFIGVEHYTDKKTQQPRQVKKYRVQVAGKKYAK